MRLDVYTGTGLKVLFAGEGKAIARKDGTVLGEQLWLGINDNESNYMEVDAPVEGFEDDYLRE